MRQWRRPQEFEEEGGGFTVRDAVGGRVALDRAVFVGLGDGFDVLGSKRGLWVMRDVFLEGGNGAVEQEVEYGCEDEEDDHEGQGAGGFGGGARGDAEEPDQADLGEVDAGRELVEGFGEGAALRVDCHCVHGVEEVVAEGEVEEGEGDGGEGEHQGSDAGVGNGYIMGSAER